MEAADIPHYRLINQQIASDHFKKVEEVVEWLGAMQAQDYPGAKWSIGMRLYGGGTNDAIEKAIAARKIVRTWPMRGTLHFVAAKDIRWLLALTTPRILARVKSREDRLRLTPAIYEHCKRIFTSALRGGNILTREEMMALLEKAKISTASQRGYHILWRLAQEGCICFGPIKGKQQTFVLMDEWIPKRKSLSREKALIEIVKRYFTSHGPATISDFTWWSGLTVSDAKAGIAGAGPYLHGETINGSQYYLAAASLKKLAKARPDPDAIYLLPGFDEYLLGYRDRTAVLDLNHAQKVCPGFNGIFSPTIVLGGRVIGTWKKTLKKGRIVVTPTYFEKKNEIEEKKLEKAVERLRTFVG